MYPRLKSWAFPHNRVSAHDSTSCRRVARQRSASGNCVVPSGVLSPGVIWRVAGPSRGTFGPRWSDRLSHASSTLGELERGRFTHGEPMPERRRHRSRLSAHCRNNSVRGYTTLARVPDPVWFQHTTMIYKYGKADSIDSNPPACNSTMACSASESLPPTAKAVGFYITQL